MLQYLNLHTTGETKAVETVRNGLYMSCLLFEIQVSGSLTATQEYSVHAWPMEDGAQGRHLLIATDDFCNFLPQLPWF